MNDNEMNAWLKKIFKTFEELYNEAGDDDCKNLMLFSYMVNSGIGNLESVKIEKVLKTWRDPTMMKDFERLKKIRKVWENQDLADLMRIVPRSH